MQYLNNFKICDPKPEETFTHEFWIYTKIGKRYIDYMGVKIPLATFEPVNMKVSKLPASFYIDFFIDFTDYTNYNTKSLSFHHLN